MSSLPSTTKISFLRKKRKQWPLLPYNPNSPQSFNQHLALQTLKKTLPSSPPNHLLTTLLTTFSSFNCTPTPSAYTLLIQTISHSSHFHRYLPPILHHIQHHEIFQSPEPIFLHLIQIYAQSNLIHQALELFYRIPDFRCTPTAYSLNAILSILCKKPDYLPMVNEVILKSHAMNIRFEESSFRILINSLCKLRKFGYAVEMLNQMSDYGLDPDSSFYSCILSAMCESRELLGEQVLGFVEEMRKAGVSLSERDYYNVISFLVRVGNGMEGLSFLNQMKLARVKPDVVCYTSVLDGIISVGEFEKAEDLFDEMLVLGVVPDMYTYNVYINGLCKQNEFESAFKMLSCMEGVGCKPDVITYNTIFGALCKVGKVGRAFELVMEMRLKGVQGNLHTYRILLDGLICEGDVIKACEWMGEMLLKEFVPRASSTDQMICMLCKRGLVSEALDILKQMVARNVAPGPSVWEALLPKFELSSKETMSVYFEELRKTTGA